MAPAAFLPVEPGDKVLDLCAAPGGKSTALAAKLQERAFYYRTISVLPDVNLSLKIWRWQE